MVVSRIEMKAKTANVAEVNLKKDKRVIKTALWFSTGNGTFLAKDRVVEAVL